MLGNKFEFKVFGFPLKIKLQFYLDKKFLLNISKIQHKTVNNLTYLNSNV